MLSNMMKEFNDFLEKKNETKSEIRLANELFEKLIRYENSYKVEFMKLNKAQVVMLIEEGFIDKKSKKKYVFIGGSLSSNYNTLHFLDLILNFLKTDYDIKASDIHFPDLDESSFYTEEEIIDVCDLLKNPQDKLMIYGLFKGMSGKQYMDLSLLKVEDLDFESRKIVCPESGRIIEMDDYLEDILRDCIDPLYGSLYHREIEDCAESKNISKTFYKLNMESPYVIKVVPSSKNNNGLDYLKAQSINTRFDKFSDITGIKIDGKSIYRSGVMYRMKQISDYWKQTAIKQFIKDNNYKLNAHEVQKAFNTKYPQELG